MEMITIFFIGDSAHGFIPSRAQGAAQAIEDPLLYIKLFRARIYQLNSFLN